jgi:hypothetical protein
MIMQRAIVRERTAYRKTASLFERALYISLLSGFLGVVSYLIVHCHHAI